MGEEGRIRGERWGGRRRDRKKEGRGGMRDMREEGGIGGIRKR